MAARQAARLVAACCAWTATISTAHAYCVKTMCGGVAGRRCTPAMPGDCGVALRWPEHRATLWIDAAGTNAPDAPAFARSAATAIQRAFERWSSADCGGGAHPEIQVARQRSRGNALGTVSITDQRSGHLGALATTELGSDPRTGAIRRAHMTLFWREIAPHGAGSPLAAIALHEAGHFLGIAHSQDPSSVMTEEVDDRSLAQVALTADDIAAICAAYPPASRDRADLRGAASATGRAGAWTAVLAVLAVLAVVCALGMAAPRRNRARS